MKKISFTAVFLILIKSLLLCQDYSKDFGKVNTDEIDMTKYVKDAAAEAVILFDIGESRFVDADDYGYNIEFARAKRIKILNKAGLKYAEVEIPFYIDEKGNAETVKTIEAYSYNWENGQLNRTSLDPSTVYIEKISNRWSSKKFVIPNARPGTIIEYRYVLVSPFHFNLPGWYFQDHVPTIYSKYVVRMIPFYEYKLIMQGSKRFDYQSVVKDPKQRVWGTLTKVSGIDVGEGVKFNDIIYTYVLKDVPAFRDESYITSAEDYMIKLNFQESMFISPTGTKTEIISTWPKLVQELIKNDYFGKFMKSCDKPARKILETDINVNGKSDEERCRTIINYVKSGYKWDGFNSLYCSKSFKELLNQKKGNAAELNLFLVALLKAAGLQASPVIISTRDHGKIDSNYPFLHYFNYVLVLFTLDNQQYLGDGTETYTDFNRIPSRCINDKGLVIQEGDVKWINLNANYKSVDNKDVIMEISPETLKMKIRMVLQAVEHDAYWYKRTFQDDTSSLRKQFSEMGLPVITKISTQNFERNDLPYVISVEGEAEIEQLNDKLIISPYLTFYPKENKLKQPTRTYPIDFTYANIESYNCKIKIPEGYRVLTIPDSLSINNETAMIKVKYIASGDLLNIESEYGFKKAVNPSSEYDNIKNYFDIIIRKFNEQIVLSKK